MPTPAPRQDENPRDVDVGWPRPTDLRRAAPAESQPESWSARRRSRLAWAWIVLAVLGVALAVVAGVWYARLGSGSPPQLTVPKVLGLKESVAIHRLRTLGFAVRSVEMPGNAKTGIVFKQRPAVGAKLERGTTVTIDVASGR